MTTFTPGSYVLLEGAACSDNEYVFTAENKDADISQIILDTKFGRFLFHFRHLYTYSPALPVMETYHINMHPFRHMDQQDYLTTPPSIHRTIAFLLERNTFSKVHTEMLKKLDAEFVDPDPKNWVS